MFTFIVLQGEVWVYRQVFIKKKVKPWSIGKIIFISGTDGMNNLKKKQTLNSKFNLAYSLDFNYIITFSALNTKGFVKDLFICLQCFQIYLAEVPINLILLVLDFRKHIMVQLIITHILFSSIAETLDFFFFSFITHSTLGPMSFKILYEYLFGEM